FSSFLDLRCRMMENLEYAMVNQAPSKQVGKVANKFCRSTLIASSSAMPSCTLCESREHYLTKCPQFLGLNPNQRYRESKRLHLCLNCLRKGHSLQQCKSGNCRHCHQRHHSLLHLETNPVPTLAQPVPEILPQGSSHVSVALSKTPPLASSSTRTEYVLLATAIVYVKNRSGVFVPCRALLDSASQINFVTSRFANQLQLKIHRSVISISGIGESSLASDKSVHIFAQSSNAKYSTSLSAAVTQSITDYHPHFDLNASEWKIPENLELADPLFYKSQRIDLLIGASIFFDLLCIGQIRLGINLPTLQKTRLGWIVSGGLSVGSSIRSSLVSLSQEPSTHSESESISEILKRFWEIDNCADSTKTISKEEALCEQLFQQEYTRLESGQYSVLLPAKTSFDALGDSYGRALIRFKSLEAKLARNLELKSQYKAFIEEYLNLGHMSLTTKNAASHQYYLPHHCVQKLESTTTKLRVVFDGSAKSTSGYSLNDLLYAGPSIQPKIFTTLLRFQNRALRTITNAPWFARNADIANDLKMLPVALCGDICKMYRCVRVTHPHQFLQCILWRDRPEDEIQVYSLDTVTYGTKPAAFLAIRAMQQLSYDEEAEFPVAA
ncbi:hypothetical protein KR059_002473, partial [Drosophila kikkawai]